MGLKEILSVSGKPGLYKIIANTKNGLIVESLIDKKRIPVYAADKISNMEDISIFTSENDTPLIEVFEKIYLHENGGNCIDHKSDDKKLREYFEIILPTYDKDRVYVSDIRKVLNWYNLLNTNKILDFSEKPAEESTEEKTPAEENPDTEAAPKKSSKNKTEKEKK